ncbi:hypothetical protein FACS1894194_2680 [Bacilli bacterium]|nr:hypothetical protein FACS1894194_2680 [Bacilli bacterium]
MVDIGRAEVLENTTIVDGNQIKKYTTNNWQEVPDEVKNNPDFHHFMAELVQNGQVGIVTSDKSEAEGQLNFQTMTKADDYTLSEVVQGLAPDADHYMILPETLVGKHSQLGLNGLNNLRNHYQGMNSDIKLKESKPKTERVTGDYSALPTYVKNDENPMFNFNLKIAEGETQFTTDQKMAQSQPNFTTAPFTAEDLSQAIPGIADAGKLASGDLTQLPDEKIPSKSYTTSEHKKNAEDAKKGLLTLGKVDKKKTAEKETDSLSEAKSHDNYQKKGSKPVGKPQKTKPDGKLGIDYELTDETYLSDWQADKVTNKPEAGVSYDDMAADEYDATASRARFWEKDIETRENVTLDDLKKDFEAGWIVKDATGNRVTDINEASTTLAIKEIAPYDFNPDTLGSDFPEAIDVLAPDVDLLSGTHIKDTLATIPEKVEDNYAKKEIYIKNLYTEEGKLNKSKLTGREGVDWEYTHVFEVNGSKKFVSMANLHLPGHLESLANEMVAAEENQVYEYWELEPTTNRYKKTQWKYLLSSIPNNVEYHKHELDTLQDAYNNGVGTATSWYQLNGMANFENSVANSIQTGTGNAGGIDSWAYSMMGFRPVKNTSESELLKNDSTNQNIIKNGHISKDNLIYRTTVQQYGRESLHTPPSEILNDYIYMELIPYINPATGQQAIDGKGEPVFTWNKFYYTDKEEYYALEKISAFDYGYKVEEEETYSYTVAEPQYQTRDELPYYQQLAPVYAYTDDLYSYEMAKHSYLPTKYAYREDSLSWETYDLEAYQPSYQEKIYTPWYTYDLPEIRKYSWQVMMSEPDTGKAPSLPTTGGDAPKQQLPKTGSSDNANLSLLGATGLAAWFIAWRKLKKAKK